MSHIVEEYAKSLGVKIGYPHIESHFFPVTSERYITLQTTRKFQARDYSFWDYTVYLLKKYTPEYDIIQVGSSEDPFCNSATFHVLSSKDKPTSFKNLFYILKNSSLHLGIDSIGMHVASAYDIPSVGLYPNVYPSNSCPVWNKKSRSICIEPDRKGKKPSLQVTENPKTVDFIKPETIVRAALDILGAKHDLKTYETIKLGTYYPNVVLEVVPNFIPPEPIMPGIVANLRCDYELNSEVLPHWLSRKCNVMISSAIPLGLLAHMRHNIAALTIFVGDESLDEEYLRTLNKLNLKFSLICKDPQKLSDLRLKFFDWTVEEYKNPQKKDIDFGDKICNNTFYHSNKVLISKGKEYYSKAAWKAGIEKTESHQKLIDTDEFWEEIEHLNIYNHATTKKDRVKSKD